MDPAAFEGSAGALERRATARALAAWPRVRALGVRAACARLARTGLADVQLVRPGAGSCADPMRRRIADLAPVALALGHPIEIEGFERDADGRPAVWRAALLPLAGQAVLAVASRHVWADVAVPIVAPA